MAALGSAAAAGCGDAADANHDRARGSSGSTARLAAAADSRAACFRAAGHREVAGEFVDIPAHLPKRPPLLVAFHGLRQAATWLAGETQFDRLAEREQFVVAYPNARQAQRWQLNHVDGDGDVTHIRSLIDQVVKRVCADPTRVYLTGFSNGAGFAFRAGCELADQVAAIAPVSGSYRTQDACPAGTKPMPTLEIHGRDPWTETVPRLIADTRRRNGCTRAPSTTAMAAGISRTRWPRCNLERIYNRTIGHEWPRLGRYDTSVEVWRFVSRFRR
jgi:polyhydroxybutyrate depolymerase